MILEKLSSKMNPKKSIHKSYCFSEIASFYTGQEGPKFTVVAQAGIKFTTLLLQSLNSGFTSMPSTFSFFLSTQWAIFHTFPFFIFSSPFFYHTLILSIPKHGGTGGPMIYKSLGHMGRL